MLEWHIVLYIVCNGHMELYGHKSSRCTMLPASRRVAFGESSPLAQHFSLVKYYIWTRSGWWFGTGNSSPNWLIFFQRGWNHQPILQLNYINPEKCFRYLLAFPRKMDWCTTSCVLFCPSLLDCRSKQRTYRNSSGWFVDILSCTVHTSISACIYLYPLQSFFLQFKT